MILTANSTLKCDITELSPVTIATTKVQLKPTLHCKHTDDIETLINMSETKPKKLKLSRHKSKSEQEIKEVLEKRKADNTNKATKLWVDCFNDYLKDNGLGDVVELKAEQLPAILEKFYVEVRSQKQILNENGDPILDEDGDIQYESYCNNSMRSLRAALNRHFKIELNVNIIENPAFIKANEIFAGKMRINKQEGKGTTRHKEPISDEDLQRLGQYFERNMTGPPNATLLQEMVLFNIIFYMGRRGRENLRTMKKDTFKIATDSKKRRFIYQDKDENDKNHNENDTENSNQGRIYEIPGNLQFHMLLFHYPSP